MPLMRKIFLAIIFLFQVAHGLKSQEKASPLSVYGYVSSLQSAMFDSLSGPVSHDNLIHNRLNIRGYIGKNITLAIDFRNRLFTGDLARSGNFYSSVIDRDLGWIDLSWNVINENSFFLNVTLDRAWIEFKTGKMEICAGRQRINWGQTFVWNPNDIFNAYSFFDFDYIERPGSDAVRFQYFATPSSVVEIAVKADNKNEITAAGLYRFNKWGYDIQILGGFSQSEDYIAGAGWSGHIGSLSFRGETSLFRPVEKSRKGILLTTVGIEKIFRDNSIAQMQLMYCNNPLNLKDFNSLYSGNLTARELAFSKFTSFCSFNWAVTPLLNTGISVMWFPDMKGYFTGPSVDYSLAENLDFTLLWQHFRGNLNDVKTRLNIAFLRIKYSF